jgi:hypothetical protein
MVSSNPREPLLWTPRTQEMMGGWNPREVLDHDINPNEDSDGLSHHGRETPEDGHSRDQQDPKKRRERALAELAAKIPHISIKPQKIDDVLGRSPQFEQEQMMLEAGVGLDLNRNGIGLSNGMNAGSVRSEGPNIKYGQSNSVVPAMLGKSDSLVKGKRRYKGRHMYDDEESDEDERKGKAKRKRKKKREGKRRKPTRGGRQIKSATKRRAGNVELDVDRGSRRQAFHPIKHTEAVRGVGRSRSENIPLRLRDPIAWERKKAYERMRRQVGSLPRGLTHHADTRGGGTRGMILGGTKGTSTRLPSVARMGTSTKKFSRNAIGDPLSTHDPLFAKSDLEKAKTNISRSEIMAMKRKIEKLLQQLNKLTKATPELDNAGKVGAVVSGHESSAPTGATKTNEEDKAYRFVDMALAQEMGLVGKK